MNKYLCLFLLFILTCSHSFAQADFTSDTTAGCSPLVVNFEDRTPNATSWDWDFGNGSTSTLKDPGTTYITAQDYTVTLTVGFADGSTQTVTKSNYVTINDRPEAAFEATSSTVCLGDPVQFNDLSTLGSANITEWLWDFGDGTTSTAPNPSHVFPLVGCYTITLAITDANGCGDVLVLPSYACVNEYPDASFSANNTLGCNAPFSVQFTSTGTTTLNHFWDFGNGETSTAVNPSYTYRTDGAFTVTHVISDAAGCSDTVRLENLINIGQNQVNIQASDSIVCLGNALTFNCGATPGSTVSWDFGDGNTSILCNASHTYAAPGTYTATASITDPDGCTYTGSKQILVGEAPNASFDTDSPLLCEPPFTVTFTNTSVNNEPVTYQWQFSDGGNYDTENVTHTFPNNPPEFQPYLYNISLTVTNAAGCSATETKINHIISGHTGAAITAMPRSGCAPLTVNFQDSSFSTGTINNWLWEFGDGNTSTLQNPSHTYADTGLYDVTLIVETQEGCRDTTVYEDFVDMGEPIGGDFEAAPLLACAQQPVQFTYLGPPVDSVRWIFGDGGEGTELNPEHAFTDVGVFDVRLITYNRGCADTLIKFQYVDVQPPIARFQMSSAVGCTLPFEVIFTDGSIGADSWLWDFGDGTTSTDQNPRHTYTEAGTFVVTLTVANAASGCEYAIDNIINIVPLDIDFSVGDSSGCFPFVANFTDESINATSWEWNFGDGVTSSTPNPAHTYTDPGSYHVELKVENVLGCRDSVIRYDYITAWGPDISFEVVDPSDCAPFNIQFFNNTTSLAPIVNWEWDLGEGIISNEQAPQYLYTTAGYFDISLTATDSLGCMASDTLEDYILITDPIADFLVEDTLNCPGNTVAFTNMSQGIGLTYLWEFGDGGTSTAENPTYTYNNVGTFSVKLTVTDVNNCPTDTVRVNYIVVNEPDIDFIADTTMADCPPLLVNFTPTVFSIHEFDTWQWDFGDGTISFQEAPDHVYGLAGDYTVRLIAITTSGCRDTALYTDLIHVDGPTGSFTFDPPEGCPGTEVSFSATSPNTTSFKWDFGDGQIRTGQDTVQFYRDPGVYCPILILEDGVGCEVVVPCTDSIVIHPQPNVNFGIDQNILCETGTVNFSDSTTASLNITNWLWDFGDNNTSTAQNPQHTYSGIGDFDVTLIVTNELGCTDTLLEEDVVRLVPTPQASIGLSDTVGCLPLSLDVADQSLIGAAPISDRLWRFGVDNDSSLLANDSYTYRNIGMYTITLTVMDTLGCIDSAQTTVEALTPPRTNFSANDTFACFPQTIDFIDFTPNAVTWQWNFGDGNTSFDQNPQHTYQNRGTYTVQFIVTDVNGCRDTLERNDYISLDKPQANFSVSDSVLCPDELATFADQSTSSRAITSWQWNFGDGTTGNTVSIDHGYPNSGFYDVELVVADSIGCQDTIVRPAMIEVLMNAQPLPPDLYYVSVEADNEISVAFSRYPNTLNDFGSYNLFRDDGTGTFTQVYTTTNLNDTLVSDVTQGLDANQNIYCYRVQVANGCATPSSLDLSETHCAVNLQTTPQDDAIQLDWSAYSGWVQVGNYNIYRVAGYGSSGNTLIASVPGTSTSYLDTDMFCYDGQTYRIEATNAAGMVTSWSNIRADEPIHNGPQLSIDMLVATVVDNSFIQLRWRGLPQGEEWAEILLERDSGFGFEELTRFPASSPVRFYEDMDVNVQERAYAYRIFGIDICGDQTLIGRAAKTIFLSATAVDSGAVLDWNPYEEWEDGVRNYEIQFLVEAFGVYTPIGVTSDSINMYLDNQTDLSQGNYCYRVLAYENGGTGRASISNEVCIRMDPLIHTPNAFTPNDDGINDFFQLKGIFLTGYYMAIYSRWGEQVFESRDPNEAWDGKFRGGEVPEGVYVFVALGLGFDGQRIKKTGTITLIR